MAELPDLTVFAKILNSCFKGKTLKLVDIRLAKKLNVTVKELKAAIEGEELTAVTREGKTIHLHFTKNQTVRIHLMLRGEFVFTEQGIEPKYEILSFTFADDNGFAVVDVLKQSTTTLSPEISEVPDAMGKSMNLPYFSKLLSNKRTSIKTLLMDQHLIGGIGNSYADEILWHARVSPFSVANAIPPLAVERLFKSIRKVLKLAIKHLNKDNGNELKGELKSFMKVHGSKIKKSPTGAIIKNSKIGGRVSYYTDEQETFS